MDVQQLRPSREQDAPIYLQLYGRFREAIAAGKLRPGDRVPSVRSLASELNLARGTVELAYQLLSSEGISWRGGQPARWSLPSWPRSNPPGRRPSRPRARASPRPIPPCTLGLFSLDCQRWTPFRARPGRAWPPRPRATPASKP